MQISSTKHIYSANIPLSRYALSRFVHYTRDAWFEIGNLESFLLRKKIAAMPITSPIYISGLARAGTTITLEILNTCEEVASHRYHDFPFTATPYLWRRFLAHFGSKNYLPKERSHHDGMLVTPRSPEAFEEMLWMHFFPTSYGPEIIHGLNEATVSAAFEVFYRNHIKKIMLSENATRYVAKGNYNIARLPYLHRLFPDACFVILVRNPFDHIASLIKQHRLLSEMQRNSPRLLNYMQQAGHFEFGLDRRTLDMSPATADIISAWSNGEEVKGWAMYWNSIYSSLAQLLEQNPELADRTLVLPYESLYQHTGESVPKLIKHCGLTMSPANVNSWLKQLKKPDYYTTSPTNEERDIITRYTGKTALHFGYDL